MRIQVLIWRLESSINHPTMSEDVPQFIEGYALSWSNKARSWIQVQRSIMKYLKLTFPNTHPISVKISEITWHGNTIGNPTAPGICIVYKPKICRKKTNCTLVWSTIKVKYTKKTLSWDKLSTSFFTVTSWFPTSWFSMEVTFSTQKTNQPADICQQKQPQTRNYRDLNAKISC